MILRKGYSFEHFYHSNTFGEADDVLLPWVEAKTPGVVKRGFFSPIHNAKHALLPRKKNQVHDLLDSRGYLLLGEHFVSHMLQYLKVYLTYNVLLVAYAFDVIQSCQRINKINVVGVELCASLSSYKIICGRN